MGVRKQKCTGLTNARKGWLLKWQTFVTIGYNTDTLVVITQTHTHLFNGHLSGTTRVSRYQKGKTSLDFTEARDSEWQWYQLGCVQVCTSLQTDNHASNPPLSFLQAGCPSCHPTNSVKALSASFTFVVVSHKIFLVRQFFCASSPAARGTTAPLCPR